MRRTGSRRRRSGTRRRPATSTGSRGWSSSCALPAYQSGRVGDRRALARLAGGGTGRSSGTRRSPCSVRCDATAQGRPAEAERWAEAAERAGYDGTLPDGSPSIDSWRAVLRAMRCRRGVARMRADAELARPDARPREPFPAAAHCWLYAMSRWLAGEVDEADDLLADVAEEGLELGARRGGGGGSRRARRGRDRARSVGRGRGVRRAGASGHPPCRGWRSTRPARSSTRWRPASRSIAAKPQRAHELLARAQRLRPRLTYALPYFAVQTRLELARAYLAIADAGGAETMLREIDALLRRQPDLGTLPAQARRAARQPEDDAR